MNWWKAEWAHRRSVPVLDNDPKFTCCGCCHVRTGTICLGAYNLLLQMVCMCVLVMAILHPELMTDVEETDVQQYHIHDGSRQEPVLPETALVDRQHSGPMFAGRRDVILFTKSRIEAGDAHLALALLLGLEVITVLLMYGVCKGRPVYLLPFFCFQVFDFILACLTALGHYAWLPNIQHAIMNTPDLPFGSQLSSLNSQWVALCVLLIYVLVLLVKSYFIGVVWAAYQYLVARNAMQYRFAEQMHSDPMQMLLPPDYETASKMPANFPDPPPGYNEA